MRKDVYERITNQIVAELEEGVRPWLKPWNGEHAAGRITRPLRSNGVPYRGINILMLWSEAVSKGFAAPIWMTFKQALELKAHVRKGETGSLVVYASSITRSETDADIGKECERDIPFMKGYTVFNVEQIEGLPAQYYAPATPQLDPVQRIAAAESFFASTGASISHGGNRAFYAPTYDRIQMPPFEAFRDAQSYYGTLAHETTHWTRHEKRLNREFGRKRWGDEGYAMEELVAELGAAFLSSDLDLPPEVRDDHASYIASWIKVLRDDKAQSLPQHHMRSAPSISFTACNPNPPRQRRLETRIVTKPDTILVDGRALSWRRLYALRRQQLEAWHASQPQQLALFPLNDDCRPAAERSAAGRYPEPTFLDRINQFHRC